MWEIRKCIKSFCKVWFVINISLTLLGVVGFYLYAFKFYDYATEWYVGFGEDAYMAAIKMATLAKMCFNMAKVAFVANICPIVLFVLSDIKLKKN